MPWKNGAGFTTELVVEPASGSLADGFHWRVSMAAVPSSGPFSRFPGLDRTLVLLEGKGLKVSHGVHGGALLSRPLDHCVFPGDWETQGELVDGPCRDFNVMSDRSVGRHTLQVLRPGPEAVPLPQGPVVLVFCAQGRARIPALEETLGGLELLRVEGAGPLAVLGLEPDTALIVVVLHPNLGSGGSGRWAWDPS